ncbi:glutamyl-tRNA reductase [Candidatus Albibeggiatoa sp. nov. NOAA]|uniref:glutamyl-tRNA reductase n=1 Tax=Candidatus Albibeggiatoa sp. nov. NOAA TaxID=3162724 RepID=UPI0032FB0D29|nr:glutamyl-tRNA reductase [Thiotrichaceae bacterium]
MQLIAIGLNHTTAPVAIREQVTFSPERLTHALHEILEHEIADEAVIVSTCNRTELYCHATINQVEKIIDWLCQYHNVKPDALRKHLYTYTDTQKAVHHLLRVACGLDSLVLGEPQILGQLKDAYQTSRETKTIKRLLTKAFEHSFSVAKQVRTDTAIGSSPVSVAFAAVRLAQQIFGELNKNTALLLGAGETIELAARHLSENQLDRMIVANRTVERARTLAKEFAGYAITLEEIPMHLAEADIVIASTASPVPILTKEMVKAAIKIRKHKPIFMVDIAVPRDIAEDVGDLPDVYLYTVDDLNEVIQENLRSREQAAHQAEEIIDTQVSHFMGWLKSLDAVNTIRDLREQTQQTQQELVEKAKRMLDNGKPAHEVIEYVAHTLGNKLIHSPCSQLRQASYEGRNDMINIARQLYQLEDV